MKTKLLFALLFSLNSISYAQKKVDYAFLAGVNLNKADFGVGNSNDNLGNLYGVNGGLQVQYHFNEKFSLKNRLQYNQKGYKYKNELIEYPDMSIGRADILMRFDYIDVKVLPSFNFGNKVKISMYIGPSLGFLTENSFITKYKEGNLAGTDYNSSTDSRYRENINFGITAGMGSRLNLSPKLSLGLDLIYDHGITNVLKMGEARLRTAAFTCGLIYTP